MAATVRHALPHPDPEERPKALQTSGRVLWKSYFKASASGTEPQDVRHFVGDVTGSMPVFS